MEPEKQETKLWSNAQAYTLAAICLVLGAVSGYLVHSPSRAAANKPATAQVMPAAPIAGVEPSPEQMKQMADKQVEPLLVELQKHSNDMALLEEISKTYLHTRQFSTAAEYGERAAKIKPSAAVFSSLGAMYHFAGDDRKAIDSLNHALQLDPKSTNALFNLGMLKWESQTDRKGAISAWEKLLKVDPKFPRRADVEALIAQAKGNTIPPVRNAEASE